MNSTSATSPSMWRSDLPAATLTAVRCGRQAGTVSLTLSPNGGEDPLCYILSSADYTALGSPKAGDALSEEVCERIRQLAGRRKAILYALRILECGDSNRRTLTRKLIKRGCTPAHAAVAVEEMEQRGFLREEESAARKAVQCAQKGWSRKHTYASLVSHGYSGTVAARAIAAGEESGEIDFDENRRAFILAKRQKGMTPEEIRAALWRAGF